MTSLITIIVTTALVNNVVLIQFLGRSEEHTSDSVTY